jgi:D-glycerate 3-kinase
MLLTLNDFNHVGLPEDAWVNYLAALERLVPTLQQKLPQMKLLAISGAQGTGKSTLAALLVNIFKRQGVRVAAVSLDDYYLSKTQRQCLSQQVHPWLVQRGVPGTHDIQRAINDARAVLAGQAVSLPRFSKALDDVLPDHALQQLDLLIVEGWCLGCPAQTEDELCQAVNQLEQQRDADLRWRQHVNQQLAELYQQYFQLFQFLLYLQAPDWLAVCRWRRHQEQQLWLTQGQGMTDQELDIFMASFQRLTTVSWQHLPRIADVCWRLNPQQQIVQYIGV